MKAGSPKKPEGIQLGELRGLYRSPQGPAGVPVVMLHGYGGDERSMWIFGQGMPEIHPVYSFRALYPAQEGGFRWHVGRRWPPPPSEVLDPAIDAMRKATAAIDAPHGILWVGFSQGAALAFHCASSGLPTAGVACLAGYLPESPTAPPDRLPVFWSHGVQDDRVPFAFALEGAQALRDAGADVDFCQADVGHKLSAGCQRALWTWMERFASRA